MCERCEARGLRGAWYAAQAWADNHYLYYYWGRLRCKVFRQHNAGCRGLPDHWPIPVNRRGEYVEWRWFRVATRYRVDRG